MKTLEQRLLVIRYLVGMGCACAWRKLKDWIKILIGRRPYLPHVINNHERSLFVWQYALHLGGLRPMRKITSIGIAEEGPGSQALMIMEAINFARASGLTYIHTPFTVIHHADRPMEEWLAGWETLFNLGAGEIKYEAKNGRIVSHIHNADALEVCFGWKNRGDELHRSFETMVPEFRRKYYLNKSPRANDEVTVAVHMRRGFDVSPNDYIFTSTDSILRTITLVRSVLESHNIRHKISVYSEGNAADWADIPEVGLSKYRVGRYLDGSDGNTDLSRPVAESVLDIDAFRAMQELIEADVLIMSKGFFSYYAAVISDGIKLFEPGGLAQPIDGWLLRSPDGSFDRSAFERQLSLLIESKTASS
jgi:hypothetical protein